MSNSNIKTETEIVREQALKLLGEGKRITSSDLDCDRTVANHVLKYMVFKGMCVKGVEWEFFKGGCRPVYAATGTPKPKPTSKEIKEAADEVDDEKCDFELKRRRAREALRRAKSFPTTAVAMLLYNAGIRK